MPCAGHGLGMAEKGTWKVKRSVRNYFSLQMMLFIGYGIICSGFYVTLRIKNQLIVPIILIMKKYILLPLVINIFFVFVASSNPLNGEDIVLENQQMKFVIGKNGIAKSLIYKATGEECLEPGRNISVFTVTQERPFHNEIKLAYPTKEMTFNAESIEQKGDELIVDFELIYYKARIKVDVTPHYINFTVKDFFIDGDDYG